MKDRTRLIRQRRLLRNPETLSKSRKGQLAVWLLEHNIYSADEYLSWDTLAEWKAWVKRPSTIPEDELTSLALETLEWDITNLADEEKDGFFPDEAGYRSDDEID